MYGRKIGYVGRVSIQGILQSYDDRVWWKYGESIVLEAGVPGEGMQIWCFLFSYWTLLGLINDQYCNSVPVSVMLEFI